MNFNSLQFLVFFPTVLVLYALVFRRERPRDLMLLAASYFFYMSWNWKYAGLILFSTGIDYLVGLLLSREERTWRRKALLIISLTGNLGLLGLFKYFNFFVDLGGQTLSLFGHSLETSHLHLTFLLPVGISFYTFQSLSYTIDLYRRRIDVERSFVKFALYVSFFPQLVAGPIVRASEFLPQLHRTPDVSYERINSGLNLVFRGLVKKVLIADLLAGLGVDAVFNNPSAFSSLTLLLALYGYAFQIYNDFSGYSDIAIGAARIMGYDLTLNFNRPYLAQNVREFWTRWHISLSTWLRDYLYIPLGGNRGTPRRVKFNLMVTMLLGGLWHGAALNFVFWGLWHGILLILARGQPRHGRPATLPTRIWNRLLTFHLVTVGWLMFRVESWTQLSAYVQGLFSFTGAVQLSPLFLSILAIAAVAHITSQEWIERVVRRFIALPSPLQAAGYAFTMLLLIGMKLGSPAFIYFQF